MNAEPTKRQLKMFIDNQNAKKIKSFDEAEMVARLSYDEYLLSVFRHNHVFKNVKLPSNSLTDRFLGVCNRSGETREPLTCVELAFRIKAFSDDLSS